MNNAHYVYEQSMDTVYVHYARAPEAKGSNFGDHATRLDASLVNCPRLSRFEAVAFDENARLLLQCVAEARTIAEGTTAALLGPLCMHNVNVYE